MASSNAMTEYYSSFTRNNRCDNPECYVCNKYVNGYIRIKNTNGQFDYKSLLDIIKAHFFTQNNVTTKKIVDIINKLVKLGWNERALTNLLDAKYKCPKRTTEYVQCSGFRNDRGDICYMLKHCNNIEETQFCHGTIRIYKTNGHVLEAEYRTNSESFLHLLNDSINSQIEKEKQVEKYEFLASLYMFVSQCAPINNESYTEELINGIEDVLKNFDKNNKRKREEKKQ